MKSAQEMVVLSRKKGIDSRVVLDSLVQIIFYGEVVNVRRTQTFDGIRWESALSALNQVLNELQGD